MVPGGPEAIRREVVEAVPQVHPTGPGAGAFSRTPASGRGETGHPRMITEPAPFPIDASSSQGWLAGHPAGVDDREGGDGARAGRSRKAAREAHGRRTCDS